MHFAHYVPTDLNIPNIKISFYNVRSLSAYRIDSTGAKRYKRVIQNISELLRTNHIVCLQETHLLPLDDFSLRKEFKNHKLYYNNLDRAGGMLSLVHPSVLKCFDLTVIPLPACTRGRVQAFRFDPTFAGHRYDHSLNLISWHFEGDKIAQVKSLLRINKEVRTIGGGDCNFVNSSEDAPSDNSGIILSGALRSAWT